MLLLIALMLLCIVPTSPSTTLWTEEPYTLPQDTKWPIGGYCDITQKVWVFGGSADAKSVVSFDPMKTSNPVTIHNAAQENFPIENRGAICDSVYYFNPQGSMYISQFFTSSVSFNYQFIRHINNYTDFDVVPYKMDAHHILFVLGPITTVKEMYIFNVTSFTWHQGPNYNYTTPNGGDNRPVNAIISNHVLYRINEFFAEYLDISGSLQNIQSRSWKTSIYSGSSLQYRASQVTSFYNKYSHEYELWSWGGYHPFAFQRPDIRIISTETFRITNVHTVYKYDPSVIIAFTDALSVYVDIQDKWYVIGGHFGIDQNTIYSVEYIDTYTPSQHPSVAPTSYPTTFGPTSHPTIGPVYSPTFHPSSFPSLSPTKKSLDPSLAPTANPNTSPTEATTTDPSVSDTLPPSFHPTDRLLSASAPSHRPTILWFILEVKHTPSTTSDVNDNEDSEETMADREAMDRMDNVLMIVMICILCACVVFAIWSMLRFWYNKKNECKSAEKEIAKPQTQQVVKTQGDGAPNVTMVRINAKKVMKGSVKITRKRTAENVVNDQERDQEGSDIDHSSSSGMFGTFDGPTAK